MTPMRRPACSSPASLTHSEMPTGNAIPIKSAAGKMAAMLVTAIGPKYANAVPVKSGPAQAKTSPARPMSHIESTAASARRSSRMASTPTRFDRRRLVTGVDSQLPIAIPASTVPSITVKAYVVGRKRMTSIRNQMISSANETKPDTANVRSTSRRTSDEVGAIGGAVGAIRRWLCAALPSQKTPHSRGRAAAPRRR